MAKTPWKLSVKKVPYFSSMYAANFRTSGLAGEKAIFPRSSRFPSKFQPCQVRAQQHDMVQNDVLPRK